ncbi:MAG: hypothetical protein DDT35_00419 [Firmicutes bacterium]|nr:hypothetical protein [Bacillota bacterium]
MAKMRERVLERALVRAATARGGVAVKLAAPGYNGLPDRLVLLPGGRVVFVEVKAPGSGVLTFLQAHRHRELRRLGFRVYLLDDPTQIKGILEEAETAASKK